MNHVVVLNSLAFERQFPLLAARNYIHLEDRHQGFTKAILLKNALIGTVAVPSKTEPGAKTIFGYCLSDGRLFLVDDTPFAASLLSGVCDALCEDASPFDVLFELLAGLLADDMSFLQAYDSELSRLETELQRGGQKGFDRHIFRIRRELSTFGQYYEQLADMCDTLLQAAERDGGGRDSRLFSALSNRARRLNSMVAMQKEAAAQLRELHLTEITLRQNEVMKVLTILTALFLPLTLITGWYGMNFTHMPELASPYGYIAVIGLSVLCVAAEIIIFRIKKWF